MCVYDFYTDYSCALQKEILLQGRVYATENWLCFYSNVFWGTKVEINGDVPVEVTIWSSQCFPHGLYLIVVLVDFIALKGCYIYYEGEDSSTDSKRHSDLYHHR